MHRRSPQPRIVLGLVALAAGWGLPAAAHEPAPVVVELYTSQGCNSCPPADALLGEIARQPGVIALSFHVDYWNYLGWHDPFSNKKFTYRQKEYAMALRQTGVYTPQMVVQGRRGEVGSDRRAVMQAIADARKAKPGATIVLEKIEGNRLCAIVSAVNGAKGANVYLALFDRRHATKIPRGENEGKTLTNHHVVREWKKLGQLESEKAEFAITAAGEAGEKRSGAAVLVQHGKGGAILGAAIAYTE
jgi:hypothetical protein